VPPGLTKAELRLTLTGFIVAARLILRNWKSPHKPEFTEWLKLMTETAAFEIMIARVNNVPSKSHLLGLYQRCTVLGRDRKYICICVHVHVCVYDVFVVNVYLYALR